MGMKTQFTFKRAILLWGGIMVVIYFLMFVGQIPLFLGAGLTIGLFLLAIMTNRMQFDVVRVIGKAQKRIFEGEADQVIAESLARRDTEESSPINTLILAIAYTYQGDGDKAEPFAREAFVQLEDLGVFDQPDRSNRMLREVTYNTFASALMAEGRYDEAAHLIKGMIKSDKRPNLFTVRIAWLYYLANLPDQARETLNQFDREQPESPEYRIADYDRLLLAFLRQKLNGSDEKADLESYADEIRFWEDQAARHAKNPHGARLNAVLDEMADLIGQPVIELPDQPDHQD
jgi:pentatricopeptide repeat protein